MWRMRGTLCLRHGLHTVVSKSMPEPSSNLPLSAARAAVHSSSLSDSSLSAWLTALKTADGTTRSAGGISLAAAVERESKDILTSPVLIEAVLSDTHLFKCRRQLAPLFGDQVEKQYVKDVLERAALLVDDEECSHLAAWLVEQLVTEVRRANPKGWLLERWPYRWAYVTRQLDGWDGDDPRRRFVAAVHEAEDGTFTEDGKFVPIPSDQINATAQGRTKKEAEALAAAALICQMNVQGTLAPYTTIF